MRTSPQLIPTACENSLRGSIILCSQQKEKSEEVDICIIATERITVAGGSKSALVFSLPTVLLAYVNKLKSHVSSKGRHVRTERRDYWNAKTYRPEEDVDGSSHGTYFHGLRITVSCLAQEV